MEWHSIAHRHHSSALFWQWNAMSCHALSSYLVHCEWRYFQLPTFYFQASIIHFVFIFRNIRKLSHILRPRDKQYCYQSSIFNKTQLYQPLHSVLVLARQAHGHSSLNYIVIELNLETSSTHVQITDKLFTSFSAFTNYCFLLLVLWLNATLDTLLCNS